MKTNTKLVIISLVFGMLSFANAEIKNYYINGINNTLQDAKDSSKKIEIVTGLKMEEPLYNTTQGVLRDLGESVRMVADFDELYKELAPYMQEAQLGAEALKDYAEKYQDKTFQEITLKVAKLHAFKKKQADRDYILELLSDSQACTGPGTYLDDKGEVVCVPLTARLPEIESIGFTKAEIEILLVKAGALEVVQYVSSLFSDVYKYLNYENSYEHNDLTKATQVIQPELDKGNKINIIAHSQGNLMANELIDNYLRVSDNDLKMFSVSTPDNKVFGERYGNGYITLKEDLVAMGFIGSLPANFTNHTTEIIAGACSGQGTYIGGDGNPVCLDDYEIVNKVKYDDPRAHNLVNVYLKDATGSKEIIKESYLANYEQLKKLEEPEVDYNLTLGETRKNSWDLNDFESLEPKPYSLYVPSCSKVRIDLKAQIDTFLEVVKDRELIAYDNDSGYGTRARIITDLAPGTYEIYPSIYREGPDDIPSPIIKIDYELVTQDLGEGNCTPRVSDFYVTDARMINKNAVAPGNEFNVTSYQRYEGNVDSKNLPHYPKLAYFLSNDDILDFEDILLSMDVSSIGADDLSDQERETLKIPNNTSSGKYYILFVANFESEIRETNMENNIQAIEIDVGEPVSDIYISDIVLNKDSFKKGDSLTIHSNISYKGNQTKKFVDEVYTSYYFIDSNNTGTLIGFDVSTIGSDDLFDEEYIRFKIPDNASEGKAYVYIFTDYKNGERYINEVNEDNNLEKIQVWIGEEPELLPM